MRRSWFPDGGREPANIPRQTRDQCGFTNCRALAGRHHSSAGFYPRPYPARVGNTLVPYANTEDAYWELFQWLIGLYQNRPEDFARYQAAAVRLSRVLAVANTVAAYMKPWNDALKGKDDFDGELEGRNIAMTERD